MYKKLGDIFYGRVDHPWAVDIEEWKVDEKVQLDDYKKAEQLLEEQANI